MQMQQYFRMIQRGWWIIALTTLTALVIALVATFQTTPMFRSTALLIISPNPDIVTSRDLVDSLGTLDKRSISVTYAEVLNSNRLLQSTAAALGMDAAQLRQYQLTTVVLPEANILEIAAVGPNPDVAAQLANQISQEGITLIGKLYPAYELTVLDAALPSAAPFSPQPARDASLAVALGLIMGVALAVLRGYLSVPVQAFRERVLIDAPSGAYSRRHIQRQIEEQTLAGSQQLSLMLVRADDLKDYLDVLPETSSNRLLHRITQVLRSELRGYDIVGRWSDTTFAIMLPSTPEIAASRTAERIRSALLQPITIELQPDPFALRPRVGVVTRRDDEAAEALIKRAEGLINNPAASEHDTSAVFSDQQNALI